MKKGLIALAVLAAYGVSFAQSSVTLYGLADVWVGSVRTDDGQGKSTSTTKLESGGVNTSRWGVKGSEDLGGGLKAVFKLEQGFKLDTGAAGSSTGQGTGTQAFDRQSYVGFAGGFGEVSLGKVWSAYDDVSGASNAMFDSGALAPMYTVFKSVNYIDRPVNGIRYTSPTMGGFAGAVSYSLREGSATLPATTAVNLTYGAGPLAVQFGYQVEDLNTAANDTKYTRLGATYNFGIATAKLTLGNVANVGNVNGADTKEVQVGVDYPLSPVVLLSASYAKSDDSQPAGVYEQTRKGFGLGATYTLSKRTFLYTGYRTARSSQAGFSDAKNDALALGVQHRF